MPTITCTRALWKALGLTGNPPKLKPSVPSSSCLLGDWVAQVTVVQRHRLVIALNERTLMSVAVRLSPASTLRDRFADAAQWQLERFGVSRSVAAQEAQALREAELGATRNPSVVGALNFLVRDVPNYVVNGSLRNDQALRHVQEELNETPYPAVEPVFAKYGISEVFGV